MCFAVFLIVFQIFIKSLLRCLSSSKMSPKSSPNTLKMSPRGSQDLPKRLQERSKRPQDASSSPQDDLNDCLGASQSSQMTAKRLQEASKRLPRASLSSQTTLTGFQKPRRCLPGDPQSSHFQPLKHHLARKRLRLSKHLGQLGSPTI